MHANLRNHRINQSAVIEIIHKCSEKKPCEHEIVLDFSKAFDSIQHSTLLQKFSALPISECEYLGW